VIGYLTSNYALISAFGPRSARRTKRESLALNRVFKQAPKLTDYLREDELAIAKGPLDRPISGLAIDSRRVAPGNVFFALPGGCEDGANAVDRAVSRGAVAIVTEQKLPLLPPTKVTYVRVADVRAILATVAQRFYKFPDRDMTVVGVAGENGKTTVAHLLKHFLNGDRRVGLIGSNHYELGLRTVPAYRTMPESLDIYGLMAQMRDAGCKHAVLEVDASGRAQRGVRGLTFGAAVFTHLSREQLETHAALFTGANAARLKVAAFNRDDPLSDLLIARLPADVNVVTFGVNPRAQVRAENIVTGATRTTFRLVWPGGTMDLASPLVGRFNVTNLLAAVAAAWGLGRDPVVFLARLRAMPGVPGRMERIEVGQGFGVFVDYARTGESLRHALSALRATTRGKLHVVFGCVGHADRAPRPLLARTVETLADRVYVTADNPRTERLTQIFDDLRTGVTTPEKFTWCDNRRRAIATALAACRPGDCLLLAGKGHETYQELADTVVPFDDRQVVRELLSPQAHQT
jgi:UDP-N-acetylmuramoyl-L-alanyl-D-glutamate--2,6-diaminopimelate ligase